MVDMEQLSAGTMGQCGDHGNVGSVQMLPDTETMPVMDQGSAGTWPLATLPVELQTEVREKFTITFSWLKAPTNLLRYYDV